jgi:hypothetical protein
LAGSVASRFGANRLGAPSVGDCPNGDAKGCAAGLSAASAEGTEPDEEPCGWDKLAEVIEGNADAPAAAGSVPGPAAGADGLRKLKRDFFSLVSADFGWPNDGIDRSGFPKADGLPGGCTPLDGPNMEESVRLSPAPTAALAVPNGDADMNPAGLILFEFIVAGAN